MAVERQYLRDTSTEQGTDGGLTLDLSPTQGSPTQVAGQNVNDTAFQETQRFQRTVDDQVASTSFPCSIDIAGFSGSVELRWRVQRVNSAGTVQASSAYSSAHTTTGIKTQTLTLDTNWNTGDILRVSIEVRRTGGHGNVNATFNVNDLDSFVDADLDVPATEVSVDGALPSLEGLADVFVDAPEPDDSAKQGFLAFSDTTHVISQEAFAVGDAFPAATTSLDIRLDMDLKTIDTGRVVVGIHDDSFDGLEWFWSLESGNEIGFDNEDAQIWTPSGSYWETGRMQYRLVWEGTTITAYKRDPGVHNSDLSNDDNWGAFASDTIVDVSSIDPAPDSPFNLMRRMNGEGWAAVDWYEVRYSVDGSLETSWAGGEVSLDTVNDTFLDDQAQPWSWTGDDPTQTPEPGDEEEADIDVNASFPSLEAIADIDAGEPSNPFEPFDVVGIEGVKNPDAGDPTITIPKPSGVTEGTLLIAFIAQEGHASGGVTWTPPSGWAQLGVTRNTSGESHSTSWYKVAGSSEPVDYTWSEDNVNKKHGWVLAVDGVEPSDPIQAHVDEGDHPNGGWTEEIVVAEAPAFLVIGMALELHPGLWINTDGLMEELYNEYIDDDDSFLAVASFVELADIADTYNRSFNHEDTDNTNNSHSGFTALNAIADVEEGVDVDATFPALEGLADVGSVSEFDVADILPGLTGEADVDARSSIDADGVLPGVEGEADVDISSSINVAGSFLALEASVDIDAMADVAVADSLPALSAEAQLFSESSFDVVGTLPALEGEALAGAEAVGVNAAGILPALEVAVSIASSADVEASATFPAVLGLTTLQGSSTVQVAGNLPAIEGEAAVASSSVVDAADTFSALEGEAAVAVENNVAVQSSLPVLEASVTTDASSNADVAAVFPNLDASVNVSTDAVGVNVDGALPSVEGAAGITATADALVVGTLPSLNGSVDVASSSLVDAAGSFEALEASGSIEVVEEAEAVSVSAVLPNLEVEISVAGSLGVGVADSFEALEANASVTVVEEALAVDVAGTFPALSASSTITSASSVVASATLPSFEASATTGSSSSADVDGDLPPLEASVSVGTDFGVVVDAVLPILEGQTATTSSSSLEIDATFEALLPDIRMTEPPTIEPIIVKGRSRKATIRTRFDPSEEEGKYYSTVVTSGNDSATIKSRPGGS